MKKALLRAASFLIVLLLALPLLPVTSKAADTILADYPIGTVFKIKEDGTYQDWILVSHDYLATGNQLLMRKNTIYYATHPGMWAIGTQNTYIGDGDSEDRPLYMMRYKGTALEAYLNSNFYNQLENTFKSIIKSVSLPVKVPSTTGSVWNGVQLNPAVDSTTNNKVFILSSNEVTGTQPQASGSFITYFNSDEKRKSDHAYYVRDGYGSDNTYGPLKFYVRQDGIAWYNNYSYSVSRPAGFEEYYRPCIVLPADTIVSTNNQIDGIITPSTPTISVSTAWATSNTATLSATSTTHYAVTTTNTAPSTGWQTSNVFTLTGNGTYYAWARSTTNTVSASKSFTVSKVDTLKPAVNSVAVPTTWGASNTVTISASDNASGIAAYAVTTGGTSAPVSGWQTSNSFTFSANATYYAWVKDQVGNVSASGFEFTIDKIDNVVPFINKVDMSTDWGTTAGINIQAQDIGSGIAEYAVTTSSTAPTGGWQEAGSFTLTANGTYYAWVKDHVGNTTSQQFKVTTVDTTSPSISYVTVPSGWGTTSTITISASDSASGLATYAVTTTGEPPITGWQPSKNIEISANGTYFAWAKDNVGNVSARYEFVVEKVDSTKPTVTLVNIPDEWATSSKITLSASDLGDSGLSAYAVTTTNTAPGSGWQTGTSFTLTANGTYYAWAKDGAGNISDSYEFTISKVDTDRPAVASVSIPTTWGMSSTVTVNGSDATSAIAAYAVTTGGTSAPSAGWQISQKFTFSANGTYYAWVKDQAGNVSLSGYEFQIAKIDLTDPVISSITVPTDWTATAEITINAADADTGIVAYALTSSSTAPAGGWQDGSSFTITSNGTYYAWVKDGVGNTAYKSFSFSKIDNTTPTISSVSVPTSWGAANTVTISANDTGSGVAAYAVTSTNAAPSTGWQTSKSVEVNANGKYYAWAKDAVGNVSTGYEFTVSKVDSEKPVINAVTVPDGWATSSTITISASDAASGVATYAVTTTNAAPSTGWQSSGSFTLSTNGTYYAWAKDNVGNVSVGYKFTVAKVDTDKPVVDSVSVPTAWGGSTTVTISASDTASGITAYAITTSGSAAPGSGWQESNRFTFSANGTYYSWAKDVAGNVSAGYAFTVDRIDNTVPDITEIIAPSDWATSAEITIKAADTQTGVAAYALTKSSTAPESGWQTDSSFIITANGTYYAWAKDGAGNTASKQFTFSKMDTTGPNISTVSVPSSWNSTSAITITATDAASGVTEYAVTNTNTTPINGWQTDKVFEITTNGTWYAWAKDAVGNISAAYEFTVSKIDTTAPVISAVTVPEAWATSNAVSINASDDASGVTAYAISSTNSVPSTGWQTGNSFTLTSNGTYYAWSKDGAGNVSAGYAFTVSRIDTTKPTVASVTVPTAWGSNSTVTVEATDAESGVSAYAISSADTKPSSGWQTNGSFTVTTNGTYYAWAKDQAGNVSVSYKFSVDKIDSIAPVILGVILPEDWTAAAKISIVATDTETGIAGYALTRNLASPTDGWQTSPDFTATANGTYYAWVKDQAGNTAYKYFYFNKIDTTAPNVSAVSVSTGWGTSNLVTISASDAASGVAAYAITSSNTAPLDGWQTSKSVEVSGNGTWYAWARDTAGNVSVGYEFTVSKVDSTKPIVSAVAVPGEWATSAKLTITASDEDGSGLSTYAVTSTNAAPATGWQTGSSFTVTANGSYYAWAKDAAGNISNGYQFTVSKIDTTKPAVDSVTVPTEWGPGSAITVKASDVGSGVAAFAVTKSGTAPTYGWQQSDSFTLDSNATYFAWAKDNVGNVSAGFEFTVSKVDSTKPMINDISIPTEWTVSGQVSISATDAQTGIAGYALTRSSTAPTSGWQESPDFTVTENGTWYAWVKDGAGNTAYKSCYITKIDTTAPTVTYASVSTGWDASNTATISANDAASGVAAYAVSTTDTAPTTGWQESKTLTVTGNGTYYAWARDAVGNVSAGYKFTVSKVDSTKPVINAVAVSDEWATSAKVTLTAADEGGSGLATYAMTSSDTAPSTGWQTSSSFTLTANGIYYAWAKDGAGNVSAAYKFTVSHVDTDKPVVDSVNIPTDWAMSGTVTIVASDTGSGITAYAITTGGSSAPVSGWQESNSFTFSANGKYYAWVKDIAGNVSASGFEFVLGKIDRTKPTITEALMPESWTGTAQITIMAIDEETGIAAYAVTANSTTPKDDAWQDSSVFTLAANGTYYAWAKDGAGNMAYQYIYFNKLDKGAPEITGIRFNNANTVVTVSATDTVSGVKSLYIGETVFNGGYVQYQIPDGTHYLTIYAEDNAGNKTEQQTVRVPGWFDVLDTLTIETITFDPDIKTATITAATTKTEIAGVYVNNKLCAGNPAVFTVNGAQYLEMQVVDVNGDRSAVYRQRVPGWAAEVKSLAITDCEFSYDNTTAVITAGETPAEGVAPRGITRIEINGEFFDGNPVAYSIPEGTRHLEMRAYNTDGDYSPLLIRRVPGWSEIVSTITISSVEFSDYNTRATVTALATGGDSVTGIFINDVYYEGNPVIYKIAKDVDTLHVQAVNPNGDLSAMVNKAVPKSTVKSTLKLTIEAPEWTSANRAKVKITAGDSIGLNAIMAKTGEDDDWTDVTSSRYIWIDEDTTVYASVENEDGTAKETSLDIVCFDRAAPTVTAAQQDKVVNIRAEDKKSGVKAIYVNNVEYNGSKIYGGNLTYSIPEGTTTVAVKAVDEAGNASETLELPVRTTVTAVPGIIAPSQPAPVAPPPDPEPAAIPDPEPEPEPEPVPEPEVEEAPQEEPKAAGMTQGQMAGLAAGAFTISSAGTAGALWWLRRKRLLAEVVPDFDPKFRKVYDESEFHGTKDPLGSNVTEVEFNRKIS
ncbi:MAG: hypothetical protein K0S22_1768 [Oscillospiraceae bacterium]|jgi:alpha-tubulin suppressor-like RCC1 family protein|nr:hypothetical protein [Oscillospiraceae bacterium]